MTRAGRPRVGTDHHPEHMDPVVVERALAIGGDPGRPLTPAERAEVARRLFASGHTRNQVCRALDTRADRIDQLLDDYPERRPR